MRHTSYPLAIILLLIVTSAFQVSAKPANTRQITVEPFNAIDVSFDIYIDYTISAQNSKATLTAPAATFDSVTIKVVNKVLTVSHKYKPYKTGKRTLRIALYAPEVKSITASKSGKVKVRNNIDNASTLTLETSTSGEIITKDIACTKLIATATTSGEIETGNIDAGTGSILLTTSKSGEIELKNLNCNNAALNTSTSSEVEIDQITCKKLSATSQTASTLSIEDIKAENIAATASTSAEIKLSGKTQNAELQASLSSTIKGKDLVAETATLNASTSATATVTATKQVSLKQARSGKAVYYGNPSKIINNTK